MTPMFSRFVAAAAVLSMAGCQGAEEAPDDVVDESETEVVTDAQSVSAMEICDEYGNRYSSNEEAQAAGLQPAQYGATYCQYFEEGPQAMHSSWDADGDGINDCENDGTCDHTVDYSQPRPETD